MDRERLARARRIRTKISLPMKAERAAIEWGERERQRKSDKTQRERETMPGQVSSVEQAAAVEWESFKGDYTSPRVREKGLSDSVCALYMRVLSK